MLTQTSPGTASSSSLVPQDPRQADPAVIKVMQAIKNVETPGEKDPYKAVGDKGDSHGAFQFNKDNYKNWAKQYGTDPSDFSPAAQNKVAYARITDLKNQGHDPEEIAALWNGAHVDPATKKFTYNDPEYGVKFRAALQGGAQTPQNPAAPATALAASGEQQPQESLGHKALDVAGKVGDFFFPVAKDLYNDVTGQNTGENHKTALQQVGDAGLSALSLIPGLGAGGAVTKGILGGAKVLEAANVASKAAKVAKVGSEVVKGTEAATPVASAIAPTVQGGLLKTTGKATAMGYGADVASNLSQGKTDAGQVLTPGLGTATGGVLGAGSVALGSVGKSLGAKWVNSLVKPLKKDFAYGKNPGRAVAEEGIVGNSLDDLAANIGTRRKEIGTAIESIGESVPQVKINLHQVPQYDSVSRKEVVGSVLKPIDDAMEQAAKGNNPTMVARLHQAKKALTENLAMGVDRKTGAPAIISKGMKNLSAAAYKEAQVLKQDIGDMTQWTGNPSDDKVINAALQRVWGNISEAQKRALSAVDPKLRVQLEKLNQRYGDLTSAEVATKYREAIHGRQNLISLGDKLSAGAGLMTGLLTGTGPIGGGVGAAAMAGVSHALGTTAVKSRIGAGLAKMGGAQSLVKTPSKAKGVLPGILKTGAIRAAANQNQ